MPANTILSPQTKTTSISYNPDTIFTVPDSSSPGSKSFPSFPSSSHPPQFDDSASSDDPSFTDPFHQRPSPSDQEEGDDDDDVEEDHDTDGSNVYSIDSYPSVSAKSPAVQSTAAVLRSNNTEDHRTLRRPVASSQENVQSRRPTGSSLSLASYGGMHLPDGSTAEASRTSLRSPGRLELGAPSSVDSRSRPLASRSGNRDRMPPPPPPKNHHGRLISAGSGATSSHSQTTPRQASNRFSFHGTPSEPSYSPRPAQPVTDYFSGVETSQSAQSPPADTLRRSQSQHKRPPTPPLSRRHSQMRRSNTASAKVNPVRRSIATEADPAAAAPSGAIPPPSLSSWSLHAPRTRNARLGSTQSDDSAPSSSSSKRLSLQIDTSTPWNPGEPGRAASPSPSIKRASVPNPPPPPPRRSRGSSNHSPDSSRLSLRSGKAAVTAEGDDYVPHPSNANDILADLTRLQKEVDDLRGHYESRKASH
ncbi:uncharacterized protein BP01DRAFT_63666 [Aspergillus saccharolyticus JOP 1030-1]|uniref:Uncharacterized protein n=1 Tax=Aspergillus saccharolyticus JOP 1030-1 TaxID=1450539 RepID=A0A318ZEC7_9EURO|nr:hypothetical protein BP01DRAFT_63666 [Aspergillus saccharolyticus JOP 1030-1]PYH44997.1 hypothetical protein BP01DRAFT_63666 [Aspergillus saccharolyticus JOP 1030-1]